ncbi:hypothetical protein Zmor_005142 [Zophobas morio]|uniref:Uncharacterized protein n=1 Tax=Zophobas morio TaxID=2755281 RepID=A0AA38IXB3_9CUCU|nr:hypothetical protein Zmor_005142 [Zophobas morio]
MSRTVGNFNIEYQLRKAAAILGIIQGFTWIILSVICIAFYIKKPFFPSVSSYMDQIGFVMYMIFLSRETATFPHQALKPPVFFGFMWVYLAFNILWVGFSLRILNGKTSGLVLSNRLKQWAEITLLISLLDLITVIILGVDYHNCVNMYGVQTTALEETCANGFLPVLVIAAKGFVLWIVNVIFGQVLYNMSRRMRVEQIYVASTMASSIMVQPNYRAPVYPTSPTASNWNPAGSPYPQYQQQMSYSNR